MGIKIEIIKCIIIYNINNVRQNFQKNNARLVFTEAI